MQRIGEEFRSRRRHIYLHVARIRSKDQSRLPLVAYSDGSTNGETSPATWSASDPTVAFLNNDAGLNGMATHADTLEHDRDRLAFRCLRHLAISLEDRHVVPMPRSGVYVKFAAPKSN